MEISMPRKDVQNEQEQNKVKASTAVTVLLGKDSKVFYYFGEANYEDPDLVKATDFSSSGLRSVLLGRNRDVVEKVKKLKQKKLNLEITGEEFEKEVAELKKDKNSPVVLIKPTDFADYSNLIDALDEMQICNIGRYAIVDITPGDLQLLENLTHDGYVVREDPVNKSK